MTDVAVSLTFLVRFEDGPHDDAALERAALAAVRKRLGVLVDWDRVEAEAKVVKTRKSKDKETKKDG